MSAKHHVYIHKVYLPAELRPTQIGKEDYEQWTVLASSRSEAAKKVWDRHGVRLLKLIGPQVTRLPRIISLHVSAPGIGPSGNAGRLQPIRVV